jgi:hypothetical protein
LFGAELKQKVRERFKWMCGWRVRDQKRMWDCRAVDSNLICRRLTMSNIIFQEYKMTWLAGEPPKETRLRKISEDERQFCFCFLVVLRLLTSNSNVEEGKPAVSSHFVWDTNVNNIEYRKMGRKYGQAARNDYGASC